MKKKDIVKIIQISAISFVEFPPDIYGLGDDQNVYIWKQELEGYWVLNN